MAIIDRIMSFFHVQDGDDQVRYEIVDEQGRAATAGKAGKVSGGTAGNLVSLKDDGDIQDSGKKPADFVPVSDVGSANGVAELDESGRVPVSQLPGYVNDVLEGYFYNDRFYEDSAHTVEVTPESGKIYVDVETNKTYRWGGSMYVVIASGLALGETDSTAYRGDRGAEAYSHAKDQNRMTSAVANGFYKVGMTDQGHVASLTQVGKNDITSLGIAPTQDPVFSGSISMGRQDGSNVGTSSVATGYNTKASGNFAHAEGYQTEARSNQSHAEGASTIASNYQAHAEGDTTTASGGAAHAEGSHARAVGANSHAEGSYTQAYGNSSHAEGYSTSNTSSSYGARGKADHVEGYNTYAYSGSNSSFYGAHAEGDTTKATGRSSHAEGKGTTASGYDSHAEGNYTTASASYSHAEGATTTASGNCSHAEGANSVSAGQGSHAEGYYSTANGYYTHAEGHATKANGYCSHARNEYTTANGDWQTSSGKYNIPDVIDVITITDEGASEYIPHHSYNAYSCYFKDTSSGTTVYYVPHLYVPDYVYPSYDAIYAGRYWHGYTITTENPDSIPEWNRNNAYAVSDIVKMYVAYYGEVKYYQCHNAVPANAYYDLSTGLFHTQNAGTTIGNTYSTALEIVGNGQTESTASNARTLDWDGNERLMGDLYVNCNADSTGGSKVATESSVQSISATVQEIGESVEMLDGFLETNDLDAEVGGKTNTLITPYVITDLLNNSIILSNGNVRTAVMSTDNGRMVSPLIEVVAGKTYGLKVTTVNTIGDISYALNYGYGLYQSDGTTPVARSSSSSLGNNIYLFVIPQNVKYIRFTMEKQVSTDANNDKVLQAFNQWILLPDADNTIDDSFFVISQKKANGEIDKIKRIDGSYLSVKDTTARASAEEALAMPITFGRRTCAIFEKVCFIGDSFTAGYIYNSSGTAATNNAYSWVKHLENMTGRDYVNCGISGATTKTWLTDANGLAKAQISANKAQAYVIGLQINDAAAEMTVGTTADIGTSADSYYGYTSKIIDEMFTINGDAHVFLLTQPKNYTGAHTPYREAILNIVEWYQTAGNGTHQNQVHLIDLLDYYKLFLNEGCSDSSANGHYTAVGWEYTAEIIMYAWSQYMNKHPLLFQDVNLIPFGTN